MNGDPRRFKLTLLAAGDLLAAFSALLLTLSLRYGSTALTLEWPNHVQPFTIVFLLWLAIFYIVGLYDFDALRSRIELLGRAAEALVAAFLVSMAVFYFTPGVGITPKTNLVIVLGVFAILFLSWRMFTMHLFSQARFHLRVLFLGDDEESRTLNHILQSNPHLGYTSVGIVPEMTGSTLPASDVIVVARTMQGRTDLTARLYRKFFQAITIVDLPNFYEKIRHSVPESALDERWIIDNLANQDDSIYEHVKHLGDILCGVLFAVPTLLLSPVIAAAIWIEDRGPILYRQTRVGKGGRPFSIVKFRTMRIDAEKNGAAFAQEHDPRVTRLGRFLRATRLDELPQIWNILRGEMSFVGPRPERPEIEDELAKTIPLFPVRHLVRPGLTGWAQVSAPYAATHDDHLMKLRHDLYYLKHRSLALDVAIVLKTIYSVLKRKGR
ncbi:MAG: sugar transferase [Patescibacteria group bacterium]|jgi:exopolysaccharide biosynthesis polyprenyl glycosylphosphotransferase